MVLAEVNQYTYSYILDYIMDIHKGQYKHNGENSIRHLTSVADLVSAKGFDLDCQIVALLKDTINEGRVTKDKIYNLGLPSEIVNGIISLTNSLSSLDDTYNNSYGCIILGASLYQTYKNINIENHSEYYIKCTLVEHYTNYANYISNDLYTNPFVYEINNEIKRLYISLSQAYKTRIYKELGYYIM